MVGMDKAALAGVERNVEGQIKAAAIWDGVGKPIYSPGHHDRICFFVEILSRMPWKRILDLGPMSAPIVRLYKLWATGRDVAFDSKVAKQMTFRALPEEVGEFTALDITNAACRYYKDNGVYDHVVRGTWDYIPLKPGGFDLVLWSEGPEHAPDPEAVMNMVGPMSSKWIVTSAPNWPATAAHDHFHAIPMSRLRDMVINAGFHIVEEHILPPSNWQIVVGMK